MKRVLTLVIVVVVLLMGTFAMAEETLDCSNEMSDFTEGVEFTESGFGGPTPCGGGGGDGGGQGGIPG